MSSTVSEKQDIRAKTMVACCTRYPTGYRLLTHGLWREQSRSRQFNCPLHYRPIFTRSPRFFRFHGHFTLSPLFSSRGSDVPLLESDR